jgi:hypothetical protein
LDLTSETLKRFSKLIQPGEFALSQNSERHMLRIEDISLEFGGETVILNIPSNTTKLVINSCNNRVICPVKNMINYLNARPTTLKKPKHATEKQAAKNVAS